MGNIDDLILTPRLLEVSSVELAAPPKEVWQFVRHGDLGESPFVRALFAARTLPSRLAAQQTPKLELRLDDLHSSTETPGFQILTEEPNRSVSVGAIGKVWQLDIPFHHVSGPTEFVTFDEPGWVKVVWELRIEQRGELGSFLSLELRVDATDEESWEKFLRYFRLIGPGSHFIRRTFLRGLRRRFGGPDAHEETRSLPGDHLLKEARGQLTEGITIRATAQQIWPWLVQMGCSRAGFYSVDAIDNGGIESAREIHPEWQELAIGQILPATPDGEDGFEVLEFEPDRYLVLGGLFDTEEKRQLPFFSERPPHSWQMTWAFVLEPLSEAETRLHVRARAQFSESEALHLLWMRPIHSFMQGAQLHNLAARVEGRLFRDTAKDVAEGLGGIGLMALSFFTPFLRASRNHYGVSEEELERNYLGDDLVAEPDWSWTHGIEIDAPADRVWPWVAQVGADRAGFYSYQWLENLAGCYLKNAEAIHPEWALSEGNGLILHPKAPPLPIVRVEPGRALLAWGAPDERAQEEGRPWAAASWLFLIEPLGLTKSRLISRFRTACSSDLQTRLAQGPLLLEPVGFVMDRKMLLGVKERVERAEASALSME